MRHARNAVEAITPRWLSLSEAAFYLGMGPAAFSRLVLPHVPLIEIEHQNVLDRRDLDAWADLFKARRGRISVAEPRQPTNPPAVVATQPREPATPPPVRQEPVYLPPNAMLRLPEVMRRTGLKRSSIYKRIHEGTFPEPVSLGSRAVAWPVAKIDAWLEALTRDGGSRSR